MFYSPLYMHVTKAHFNVNMHAAETGMMTT